METPLALQLQQAWLFTQLNKLPPSPPPPPSPSDSLSQLHSNLAALSQSWSSSPALSDDASSSPLLALPSSSLSPSASDASDAIMMDPALGFINDMLMDEQMEDRKCMETECVAYQAIVNGFYQILEDDSTSSHSSVPERSSSPGEDESVDDYNWIDDILVAEDPGQPAASDLPSRWPPDSSGASSFEQDVKPFNSSFSSSSGGSSDSPDSLGYPPSNGSWNTFPSAQNYAVTPLVNGLANSAISHHSAAPALPNSAYPVAAPEQVDLEALNRFRLDGSSQSLLHKAADGKFRRVRSDDLQYNPSPYMKGNQNNKDGFKRATSDKVLDKRRQLQEDARSFPMNSSMNGTGANFLISDNFAEPYVKKELLSDVADAKANSRNASSESSDEKLSFVKNEDLKAENFAKLYGEWSPRGKTHLFYKEIKETHRNGASVKRSDKPDSVDLRALLASCAQTVAANDLRKSNDFLQDIRRHSSPQGTSTQRLAYYFAEALFARLSGTGARLYTAMSNNIPSAARMLKAYHVMFEVCPYVKITHYFANQSILKAAKGASRLHIVDYGILYGIQWPCLISALAERKGGPPFLRITGIEFPQPGINPAERVEETGRRLAEYARAYSVPFEYQAVANKWEDIEPESLHLRPGEVLAVNCMNRLRHLLDETVVASSPRKKVLSRMRSLNPEILVIGVINSGHNAPFFVSRFREALYYYSSKFDMIETTLGIDCPERLMIERECMGRDILNIVACEGPERVERPETYRQWQARFQRAGFELQPLNPSVVSKSRAVVKAWYHKDFGVDDDSKWMQLAWKGRIKVALSSWKPSSAATGK